MAWFAFVAVALIVAVGIPAARGQDPDETKRLRDQIELLEGKLKNAEKEIELLKKELEQAKKGGEKPMVAAKASLSDLLAEGVTIRGDFKFITGKKESGDWALTINERTGKKFKGTYTAKQTNPPSVDDLVCDAEGEIDGDRIKFSATNTTKAKGTITGVLKNDSLKLVCSTSGGGRADMVAKVTK